MKAAETVPISLSKRSHDEFGRAWIRKGLGLEGHELEKATDREGPVREGHGF
jgi:hypothetical protein